MSSDAFVARDPLGREASPRKHPVEDPAPTTPHPVGPVDDPKPHEPPVEEPDEEEPADT